MQGWFVIPRSIFWTYGVPQCYSASLACVRPWVSSLAVHAHIYTITTSKINYLTFDIYHNMDEFEGLILGEIRQACRVVKIVETMWDGGQG